MTDAEWLAREAHYHRLIRDAYNEGFNEGMREHTTYKGGQPWNGSKTQTRMNEFASAFSRHESGEAAKCWPIGLSPRQNQRRNAREQASGYRKSGCNNS